MRHPLERTRNGQDGPASAPLKVVAVGDLVPSSLPDGSDIDLTVLPFSQFTADWLRAWTPTLVLSPLVGTGFDCFDIAERLAEAAFQGRYRAVVDSLPDPSVVRREIATHFPALDFDVMELGADPTTH